MAETESGQEKTETASERRLQQARERGEVPRSRDLSTAALLIVGSASVLAFGERGAQVMLVLARAQFSFGPHAWRDPGAMVAALGQATRAGLVIALPILVLLTLAGIFASVALGGASFSSEALAPKFSRLDPIAGLGRLFALRSLVELVKSIGKLIVVGIPCVLILWHLMQVLLALSSQTPAQAAAHAVSMLGWGFLGMAAATAIIAAFDVPWQLYDYATKMRMSRQEVREESKDTDGRPEIKQRIRKVQQEMARKRMLADVPKADVIVTNPDHYAVALRYDSTAMGAPKLLAKGVDFMAERIRKVAGEHGIAIVQAPALARAVHHSTEVGYEIPKGLYLAVARILAYVFQLDRYRKGAGASPVWPDDLPIPDELRVG